MQLRSRGSWGSMRRFLPWLLMALLVSCGGGGGGGGTPGTAPVTPSVTISSFTASKSTITAGTGTTLTAVFSDATGASVDQGVGPVIAGTGYLVTPQATTTYTLTATGQGGPATRSVTVIVVQAPSITSFSASPATLPAGASSQLTAVFSGGAGSIDPGIGAVLSGVPVDSAASPRRPPTP